VAKLLGTEVNANRIEQYWLHPGDDGKDRITLTTTEDVEPVIEQNKALYNNPDPAIDGIGRRMARIPGVVIMELCRIHKISFRELMRGKTERSQHIMRSFLNDPSFRSFRCAPGLVKVRGR
jgi:hypothetical protein